jgi:hypothetical protein
MFSRVRDRFGTAGLIVAVVALVAALGGSAYAANAALSGKQKKEVEKISKKYAGKPGANGANGTNGSNGAAGAKGDKGDPGTNGKNVVIGSTAPGCGVPGGKTVEVAGEAATKQNVCNGKEGSPWVAGGTLPSEATETGTWAAVYEEVGSFVPLTFAIPLAAPLGSSKVVKNAVEYNGEDEVGTAHENCPGKASNPRAAPGFLCVYAGYLSGESNIGPIFDPTKGPFEAEGASVSGAVLMMENPGLASGTWAVTAP